MYSCITFRRMFNCTSSCCSGWDEFKPEEASFKPLYDVYKYFTEELGEKVIILESDDLLNQPGKTKSNKAIQVTLKSSKNIGTSSMPA